MKKNNKYNYIQGTRIEDHGTRLYDVNGARLPSVTTILGATKDQQFLKDWKEKVGEKLEKEKVDITLPERPYVRGKIHPVSQTIDEISSIFSEIGFSVEEGPDVENEYNNFTALNTPDNHPARDMHDTFYLDENKEVLLKIGRASCRERV